MCAVLGPRLGRVWRWRGARANRVGVGVAPQVSFEVRSPSSGVVGEYFANEGDTVAVGQPLFRLTAGDAPDTDGGAAPTQTDAAAGGAGEEAKELTVDVPSMGDSIVDGTLSEMAVQPGGQVAVNDVVAVIDTDKVRRSLPCGTPTPWAMAAVPHAMYACAVTLYRCPSRSEPHRRALYSSSLRPRATPSPSVTACSP